MTKHFLAYNLALWSLACLTGCELQPNIATKSAITQSHPEFWLRHTLSQDDIQQEKTAYLPLYESAMSMAARLYLINNAKHNLDLQYYIWKNDYIGNLMLAQLLKAADRGVKVKILIDDQNGTQLDEKLKALAQHPNFEVRLFNPYKFRKFRVFDYAFRLKKINHRMHNKLIIADGTAAVTGGRNISSEYFDASNDFQFSDVDIFFAGEATQAANRSFHAFWNDQLSYDIEQILPKKANPDALIDLQNKFSDKQIDANDYKRKLGLAEFHIEKHLKEHPIGQAKAHFVADPPDKARATARHNTLIYSQMLKLMGEPKQHLELVSAYFVPTQQGADYLSARAKEGIRIRVLTNSFLANDVPLVHGFYKQYRAQLLANGVQLWEFKPNIQRTQRTWYEVMTGNVIPAKNKNSSRLHAKFFDIDGMVFIGSFNFDPRSANLNTEVGLVVESNELQDEISAGLDELLPQTAYELKLDSEGNIIWLEHLENGQSIQHANDPETTKFQRFMMNIMTLMPIEWMM